MRSECGIDAHERSSVRGDRRSSPCASFCMYAIPSVEGMDTKDRDGGAETLERHLALGTPHDGTHGGTGWHGSTACTTPGRGSAGFGGQHIFENGELGGCLRLGFLRFGLSNVRYVAIREDETEASRALENFPQGARIVCSTCMRLGLLFGSTL